MLTQTKLMLPMAARTGAAKYLVRLAATAALLVMLVAWGTTAHAAGIFCSQFGGVVDGNNPATLAAVRGASTFGVDTNCTIKNFPDSIGGFPITNINFNFPQQQSYYIAFLNVFYYGNMSCNDPTQSDFWIYWAPGGYNNISPACQAFMVPVDAVSKKNPPAQTTAAVGVPFTYTISVPLLGKLDATGTFQYIANSDDATVTNVVIPDDLTATGAALSYVTNAAYLVNPATGARTALNGGAPLALGAGAGWLSSHPGVLSDATRHLVFSYEYNPALASLPAGYNLEIQVTVVLDNNPTGVNQAGAQFSNTANMWFNKPINTASMVDLQAWPGTTPPMTVVEPNLTLTKSGSAATVNMDSQVRYTLNVQNTGGSDAWNATVTDHIPAGMSTVSPLGTISAQVFASDGATPVSAPLVSGTDFTTTWSGGAGSPGLLTLALLDSAKIAPTQRLIVTYLAQVDSTGVASGATLTNIAGATRWFSANSTYPGRREYDRTITDGTPGTLDFQDAYTVTAALAGYYFQKTVRDLTTGANPATAAFPGDRLHYTLLLQNFTWPPLNGVTVTDTLPAGLRSVSNVTVTPAGGTVSVTQPSGGTPGAVTVSGLSLPGGAATNAQVQIEFDATLDTTLANGTMVSNQAGVTGTDSTTTPATVWSGPSDDPYVNGTVLLGSGGDPTRVTIQAPGALSKTNPSPATATIGQQFSYQIKVPATPADVPLYDVRVLDNLGLSAAGMSFVSADVISGGTWNLTNTGTATNVILQDLATGIDIPAGGQAVIQVTAALQNSAVNRAGLTFNNTASYTYNKLNGDSLTQSVGGAATTANMTVVEPHLTAAKAVGYASPAGKAASAAAAPADVLRYTVTVTNDGGSRAYDADVMDFLPANVALVPGSATAQVNGAPVTGFMPTPALLPSGAVDWGSRNGDASLDIPAGGTLVLSYLVTVLETSGAPITNDVYVDWTSLSGSVPGERTGAGCPSTTAPNTYCSGPVSATVSSLDPTALAKTVVADSWSAAPGSATDATVRVGDTVVYNVALTLREGTTQNVVLTDQLPTGLAYDALVSIAPASGSGNFSYTVSSQPAPGATGTLTWNLGNVANTPDNNAANNTLTIQYRAHVMKNALAQSPTAQQLVNSATLNYAINGVAATPKNSGATLNVWQPLLNVSKTRTDSAGTVISAGEAITYTVTMANSGTSPAYNPVLADTLPVGLRQGGVTTTGVALIDSATGATSATLPVLAPSYSAATGVATWNFDAAGSAGLYAVAPGQALRVSYQVKGDAGLGAGVTLNNQAQVSAYYSFDSQDVPAASVLGNRQFYGPTTVATVQLTTAAATALSKQAQVTSAAIGRPFSYTITVPAVPQPAAMYDVRVLDDLSSTATGVDLRFVGVQRVSGPAFTPVNTGSATSLVIQDSGSGIDIPAGQQAVINVTVLLTNSAANTLGKQFQNTATYTYNGVNNTPATQASGAPGASAAITVVGPALTVQKSGPATINALAPGLFTLNVQNTGGSTAWQATLTDLLPNVTTPAPGSMCGSAPTNVTARVYQADGVTPVSANLVNGTDFTVSFAPAPACTMTVAMKSAAAAIAPGERLLVNYSASLDPYTAGGITLTNVAGATRWLSADPAVTAAADIQATTAALTNGTPGVLDVQDAFTVTTQAPLLSFTNTVQNATTGQSGANARPGDTLKYTLTIRNLGTLGAANFTLTDELDKLNAVAMFAPGTLKLLTAPSGANVTATSANGGSKGTGVVSIGNLTVAPQGQAGDVLTVEFQATLAPVIDSGSLVQNQAQVASPLLPSQLSDDPSLPGTADPTRTVIASAPRFLLQKTVRDVTSGSATVTAGDTLRYSITVKNDGTENATGVTLRDQVPANTAYVPNSTTLNGKPVADVGGASPLQSGMTVNSPANPVPGTMPAAAGAASNVATITFEVRISRSVVAGTLISNQAFLAGTGAASGPFPEEASDNPATPVPNDPTTVVVGNLPLLYALKTVQLVGDANGDGLVDPGDELQYTITMTNSGGTAATGVLLTDAIPANTTYVANSVRLNGAAVADAAAGVSPLTNGIGVVSPGVTPPAPPATAGTLAAGGTGVVTFKVQVNQGVAPGTVISNQGSVASTELPLLATDSDGTPTNGYQPTVIAVGNAQQLSITKSAVVVGGGAALPGSVLEYTVRATNVGLVPATGVVLTDDLTPLLPQASYLTGSGVMNGSSNGVTYAAPVLSANYGASYGPLAPGAAVVMRFQVKLNATVSSGSVVNNTAQASWDTPTRVASAGTSVTVGGMPGSASLTGSVWQDANHDNVLDGGELPSAGWTVDLYQDGRVVGTVKSSTDGSYRFSGVPPNAGTAIKYELRFRAPGAGAATALLGWCSSPFTNGMQRISDIVAGGGSLLQELNLPLTPNGVVYNSIVRTPVPGATLTMVQAGSRLPVAASCFNDPVQQGQVTTASGLYKFDLNFSDPSCPSGGEYLIQVTPPATGYMAGVSKLVPPASSDSTASFAVPACPSSAFDAVPTTAGYCEAQASDLAPGTSVLPGAATAYYLRLTLDNLQPGYSQIYNNHIAVDPTLNTAVAITKTAAVTDVSRGALVPYTITLNNTLGATLRDLSVVDTFPAGFKYVAGSARLDGRKAEPTLNTRQMTWSVAQLTSSTSHSITFLMIVGSGVSEGEYVNRAQVLSTITDSVASGVASATVRVIPDADLDCTDVIGKVFDDANANGYPDQGEKGLAGVRAVTARGLVATTDEFGRFHITCAVVPDQDRGSNFILKLDERTLPTGYRVTGENPQVQRATRGKMLRFDFGAAIHHVVSLDVADGAFEPNGMRLRRQWQPRIDLLLKELRKAPAVLRLSYLAEVESKALVEQRLKALKTEISGKWGDGYPLTIETEVFWRRGAPP
ncbi:isopeptide-forming domain-containing fimbrial protein [Geomonas agri]|uniref:isopeptide-forming domain-containing fimbrial protein n=1 Tax=Geomonas agri TaxID=2873702 RepID=UPI001CD56009|nr:isopeptide-forming domain-containing fimbrial protein [Geomonas agri]